MTARMTPAEAVVLCRFAKACCPQQAFDEYTPDAWFELLKDHRFEDCKEAVISVVKRQPFCSPAEIRSEMSRVRSNRISAFGRIQPEYEMFGDDFAREIAWINDVKQRVGDGSLTREEYEAEVARIKVAAKRERAAIESATGEAS